MTNQLTSSKDTVPRASWIILAAATILTTVSGLFVAITPAASQTDLAGRTWEGFAATDPEVAALFSMQLFLVGVSFVAFTVFGTIITLVPYRNGERWAWFALWLLPLVYGLVSIRMLSDQYEVGYFYLGFFVISLIGLLIPIRRFV
jgi:hypothetical protein